MKTLMMFIAGMVLATPLAQAADEPVRDREALREELAEARRELSEAARRVAELGRELGAHESDAVQFRVFAPDAPRRAMLGIAIGPASDGAKGVEVLSVTPGGPADKAGIQAGDVVTMVGKTDLAKASAPGHALIESLEDAEPGSQVEVNYLRGDDARTTKVTLEAVHPRNLFLALPRAHDGMMPELPVLPRAPMFLELMHGWGNIELVALSKQLGEYFGTDKGLLVVRAPRQEEFKLQDGDVILAIDGRQPEDPGHAVRMLGSYRGGEKVMLDIMRKQKKMSMEIEVPERLSGENLPLRVERKIVVATPEAPAGTKTQRQ